MLQAAGDGGELFRDGPCGIVHDRDQMAPFFIRVADDHAPVVVPAGMRAIGVVRRDRWPPVIIQRRRARPVRAIAWRKTGAPRASSVHREIQLPIHHQHHFFVHVMVRRMRLTARREFRLMRFNAKSRAQQPIENSVRQVLPALLGRQIFERVRDRF